MSRATANWLWIRLPTYMVCPPPSRSGARYDPSEGMKTRRHPAAIPGAVSGMVTRQRARKGAAPRSGAASSSERSSFSMDAYRGRIMNGSSPYTWPSSTAKSL